MMLFVVLLALLLSRVVKYYGLSAIQFVLMMAEVERVFQRALVLDQLRVIFVQVEYVFDWRCHHGSILLVLRRGFRVFGESEA